MKKRPHVVKMYIDGECDFVYTSQQAAKEQVHKWIRENEPQAVILFSTVKNYLMYRDKDCIYVIEPYGKEDNDG